MKTLKNMLRLAFVLSLAMPLITACTQQDMDREIKADITSKAKDDVNFAGVQFTVENSKVTLFGSCPTSISKGLVKQKLSRTFH